MTDGDWLIVEARRDDGTPAMFRIRELAPLKHLTKIFVVELPYPKTELSRLPNASDYRRLAELEEQWLRPACSALGWEHVGTRTEDGSFFIYLYGSTDPNALIEKLSPFDAGLGFYDDEDPEWQEYGTLRELLDQAKAIPPVEPMMPAAAAPVGPRPAPRSASKPTVAAPTKQPDAAAAANQPSAAAAKQPKAAAAKQPAKRKRAVKASTKTAKKATPKRKKAKAAKRTRR